MHCRCIHHRRLGHCTRLIVMVECAPDDDALHARLLTPRCRKALYVLTDMVLGCSRSMTVLALQRPGGTNYFCVLRCALQHAAQNWTLPLQCLAACSSCVPECRHVLLGRVDAAHGVQTGLDRRLDPAGPIRARATLTWRRALLSLLPPFLRSASSSPCRGGTLQSAMRVELTPQAALPDTRAQQCILGRARARSRTSCVHPAGRAGPGVAPQEGAGSAAGHPGTPARAPVTGFLSSDRALARGAARTRALR